MDQVLMSLRYEMEQFTPAEAGAITKLSPGMQRDWRHRGLLGTHETHARFDAFDVAEMMVMKLFADQGKGPSLSRPFAPMIAETIVWTAITWSNKAWSVPPRQAYERLPQNQDCAANDDDKAFWVARDFFESQSIRRYPTTTGPHAIWWPTGTVEIGNYGDLSSSLAAQGTETEAADPKFDGAAIVLPLDTIAANLVRAAPRPLVRILQ